MSKPLPYSWQEQHVADLIRILSVHRFALDTSNTGTGKTYTALFAAQALNLRPFILCPKALIPSWTRACEEFGITPGAITNYEKVVNVKCKNSWCKRLNSITWSFSLTSQDLLILDEAHRCRNYNTATCKFLVSAAQRANHFRGLLLSATLAESPLHFKGFGEATELFPHGQFWPWCLTHGVYKGKWCYEFTKQPEQREFFLGLINKKLYPDRASAIKSKEVPGFPENNVILKPITLDPKDEAEVQKELDELREKRLHDVPLPIVDLLRVRQKFELLKAPAMAELAADAAQEGNAVVLFVDFLGTSIVLERLLAKEGLTVKQFNGSTPDEERTSILDAFQTNKLDALILQSSVGGIGLSLHDINGRPRVSLISPTYSAIVFRQVLGRICRAGSLSPATQYLVFADGSVEGKVMKAVNKKIKNLKDLLDADLDIVQ